MSAIFQDPFSVVPKGMRWCPYCNGYGSSLKQGAERCSHCAGTGLVSVDGGRPAAERGGEPPARH